MSLVSTCGLTLAFSGKPVLRDIDFEIAPGEIVTLVGPNGSGKSTLARAIIGALNPVAGQIERAENLRIGYVPQRLEVGPTMPLTVGRFLELSGRRDAISDALMRVNAEGLETEQFVELSGGQRQRVLLARALLGSPNLLVLDEPTTGLDQPATAALYRLIADIRGETGCAVLLVSHDLHVVMSASDRVICLNGHICCQGTPTVVSSTPEYRALFGLGTGGALALYPHAHDHSHDSSAEHHH